MDMVVTSVPMNVQWSMLHYAESGERSEGNLSIQYVGWLLVFDLGDRDKGLRDRV